MEENEPFNILKNLSFIRTLEVYGFDVKLIAHVLSLLNYFNFHIFLHFCILIMIVVIIFDYEVIVIISAGIFSDLFVKI